MPRQKSEILHLQKVAFFEAYTRIRKENSDKATLYPKQWLVHKTLNSTAPQTYISTELAQKLISQFEKGTYTPCEKKRTEERNQNLYKAYLKLVAEAKERGEFIVKTLLVEEAIELPTPKFYISQRWASQIVFEFDKKGGSR